MARRIIKPQKINIEITDIQEQSVIGDEVTPTQIQTIPLGDQDDIEAVINNEQPKAVNIIDRTENRLEHCDPIPDIEKLKEKLIKLGIRFDTDPKLYQKPDYWLLMCILYRALTHLYESNPGDVIVTDWLEEHSDTYVPSEKLVKETLDQIVSDVDGSIFATNTRLDAEIQNRQQADQKVMNDLLPLIYAGL